MNEHETIANIIAEIRALSNTIPDGIIAINGKSIADRIEAAHKRESGDCAKLREAAVIVYDVLEKLRPFSLCLRDVGRMREFSHLVCLAKNRLDAALGAPPRNCDVGTAEEQTERMDAYCARNGERIDGGWRCDNCPLCSINRCELAWAQMPYEEGGEK